MKTNDFILKCENSSQNIGQMFEIHEGFKTGLTIEQVKLYADPKFTAWQMYEIREFIIENKNLHIDTLKFIININF